ncbi:MAG: NlpC/P60 family protein [Oscillatoriales cyanobacterium]|nr:MAG: NlpC/P60 family protein [Oscillatoriales cyanobacterium]
MVNYQLSNGVEYRAISHINIYDSPKCDRLATQAALGRHLLVFAPPQPGRARTIHRPYKRGRDGIDSLVQGDTTAVMVRLCEDDYPGWLDIRDLELLEVTETVYHPLVVSQDEIKEKLAIAITFTREAMQESNYYLWGGTVGPNYDCSGLMQAAFVAAGIWLPRDAYQQEAFTTSIISVSDVEPGDLVFFGTPEKATHVGLYIGENRYIHIDVLSDDGDAVSRAYYQQLRGYGKVVASYQPS